MSTDLWITLAVLAGTMFLFTRDWLRLDVVALLSLLALLSAGILEPAEALSGFSSSVVFIIAGLFVVGAALFHTGVADWIGARVAEVAGTGQVRLTVVLMGVVAVLSAFMSSTGAVALFLPVVVNLSRRASIPPSKLLIPISFASLLGGMLTLIGTPPNIVVSEQLTAQGKEPFGFFEFTPIGLVMLAIGIVFMVTFGQRLLPARTKSDSGAGGEGPAPESVGSLAKRYGLPESVHDFRVGAESPLIGQTLADLDIRAKHRVNVLGVCPPGSTEISVLEQGELSHRRRFMAGDTLLLHGMPAKQLDFAEGFGLHELSEAEAEKLEISSEAGFAELLLPPRSKLIGETLRSVGFREVYEISVLAALHVGKAVPHPIADHRLKFGDTLLVQGPWERIRSLRRQQRDFVVTGEARGEAETVELTRRGWIALAVMGAMMVLMTLGLFSTVTVILGAGLAMVLTRCVAMEAAYRSMSWESIVVIAAMLPMAAALEKTGGVEVAATWLTLNLGAMGPYAVIAGLFVVTSIFSQFVSNTATAVLVAPIAFQAAVEMGVSERAFLMTVAVAASTAFATPIASPTNTLVLTPGGYRFGDYTKVGVPLQLLILATTVLLVPVLFPL